MTTTTKNGRRGIHTLPNDGNSIEWLTPPEIVNALGSFDLDPCSHPKQFYRTAKKMIAPPADGLTAEWVGRVWLNPPYGMGIKHWMAKIAEHGEGTAIVPARTEVQSWFWPYVWEAATAVLFLKGRVFFRKPDGSRQGNAGHGSVLVAYGDYDAHAIRASKIEGKFVGLRGHWKD